MSSPEYAIAGSGCEAPAVVLLLGPTASGKTRLALALARRMPVEIISCDSGMVYRGLDIGSAKPAPAELAAVPHHLVGVRDPEQPFSAADFQAEARQLAFEIAGRGHLPLIVGGTFLYARAFLRGLDPQPAADAALRRRLEQRARRRGWPHVHRLLARLDPVAAAAIAPADGQRLQRAFERLRGGHMEGPPATPWPGRVLRVLLACAERSRLNALIERRFDMMWEAGLEAEVRRLLDRGCSPALPALRAVGYRQVIDHLQGRCDRATMRERAIIATRQLAKRQSTWMRGEPAGHWFDALGEGLEARVARQVTTFAAAAGLKT